MSCDHVCCYYQNIRGMRTKTAEFANSISNVNFDIILLTETWLTSSFNDSELGLNDYCVYRKDRDSTNSDKQRGGGVLIAIKKVISSRQIFFGSSNIEQLFVAVSSGSKTLLFSNVYIPPNATVSHYETHCRDIENLFDQYPSADIVCCGDNNLPGFNWSV